MLEQKPLYKTFNTILIAIVFFLLIAIVAISFVSQNQPPTPQSGIRVIEQSKVTIPSPIREGETFKYQVSGTKLIEANAEIRMQMTCTIDGAKNTVTVATYASDRKVGPYNDEAFSAVSPSSKLLSSKDCRMQFIATYTVYQSIRNGELQPIPVSVTTTSNTFEFIAKSAN